MLKNPFLAGTKPDLLRKRMVKSLYTTLFTFTMRKRYYYPSHSHSHSPRTVQNNQPIYPLPETNTQKITKIKKRNISRLRYFHLCVQFYLKK